MRSKKKRRLTATQKRTSPAAKMAEVVTKKYKSRYLKSPSKGQRVRRALYDVKTKKRPTPKERSEVAVDSLQSDVSSVTVRKHFLLENCVIKGYHYFQIRPPDTDPHTMLPVDREYTNTHDPNACLIWIPPLDTFSREIHKTVTDAKRGLLLQDVAGLPIGHVPLGLSSSFRKILDENGDIFAEATGDPTPSFPPWPAPTDCGGGTVIPCNYHVYHIHKDFVMNLLRQALINMPEGEFIRLELV